jgi:hypothetical protein
MHCMLHKGSKGYTCLTSILPFVKFPRIPPNQSFTFSASFVHDAGIPSYIHFFITQ